MADLLKSNYLNYLPTAVWSVCATCSKAFEERYKMWEEWRGGGDGEQRLVVFKTLVAECLLYHLCGNAMNAIHFIEQYYSNSHCMCGW